MTPTSLKVFLALQVFSAVNAAVVFKTIPSRFVAGNLAGFVFLVVGLSIITYGIRQLGGWKSFSFWFAALQVCFFSIPMLVVRWLHPTEPFEVLTLFGLSGPQFHHLSEGMHLLLMAGTALDLFRVHKRLSTTHVAS